MITRELVETQSVQKETTKSSDGGLRTETVKLVEMGQVSLETKGFVEGLELGWTPRN